MGGSRNIFGCVGVSLFWCVLSWSGVSFSEKETSRGYRERKSRRTKSDIRRLRSREARHAWPTGESKADVVLLEGICIRCSVCRL